MGTSAASEPLYFFIIVIYDLWPTYSFLLPSHWKSPHWPCHRFTSWFYLIDITHIEKICDKVGNLNFGVILLVVKHMKGRSKLQVCRQIFNKLLCCCGQCCKIYIYHQYFSPETVVWFLHQLHIYDCTRVHHWSKHYEPWSDCSLESVWSESIVFAISAA